jgi:hypothetical protein
MHAFGETMKFSMLIALAGIFGSLSAGIAAADTYIYTGVPYTVATNHTAADCAPVGGCSDYTTTEKIAGSFTTAAPLAPNMVNQAVTPTAYSFTDGINTFDSTDPAARLASLQITTDGSGTITQWFVVLERWRDGGGLTPPHTQTTADATTPNARLNILTLDAPGDIAANGAYCLAYVSDFDDCGDAESDTFTSFGVNATPGVWTLPPPVPALPGKMLIFFFALLGTAGFLGARRRFGF